MRYGQVGVASKHFLVELFDVLGLLAELDEHLARLFLGDVSLLELLRDLLVEVEHLKLEKLLELVLILHLV